MRKRVTKGEASRGEKWASRETRGEDKRRNEEHREGERRSVGQMRRGEVRGRARKDEDKTEVWKEAEDEAA